MPLKERPHRPKETSRQMFAAAAIFGFLAFAISYIPNFNEFLSITQWLLVGISGGSLIRGYILYNYELNNPSPEAYKSHRRDGTKIKNMNAMGKLFFLLALITFFGGLLVGVITSIRWLAVGGIILGMLLVAVGAGFKFTARQMQIARG